MGRFRDWLRGYSDEDVRSVQDKIRFGCRRPGGVTFLTRREMKAIGYSVKAGIEIPDPRAAEAQFKEAEGWGKHKI